MIVLRRFDKGFERWLKSLSEKELERAVKQVTGGNENEPDVQGYLQTVASVEHAVRNCAKCRYSGCEKCTYVWALRYVVRHGKPASWWKRTGQSAVLGAARMLSVRSVG